MCSAEEVVYLCFGREAKWLVVAMCNRETWYLMILALWYQRT